jgi:hypothetical protein
MTNIPSNPAEKLLFEISKPGRRCIKFPPLDVPKAAAQGDLSAGCRRNHGGDR